jgi:acyl-coenzyme A thioesterase PaaI-like protein
MGILRDKLGDRASQYALPPPVFAAMEGEFVELDVDAESLTAQFPVRERYMNPYGTVQGGMLAAAFDNTLGPLSMLVAPPNVTRRLEVTYSRPVTLDVGYIVVKARLVERKGRRLFFRADLSGREGPRLARAKALHWIVDQEEAAGRNAA